MAQTRVFPTDLTDIVSKTKFEDLRTMATVTLKDLAAIIKNMIGAYETLGFSEYQIWGQSGNKVLGTILAILDEREEAARELERKNIQERLKALQSPDDERAELQSRLAALSRPRGESNEVERLKAELAKAQAQLAQANTLKLPESANG